MSSTVKEKIEDFQANIVIIGSGGGLAAAVAAAEKGATGIAVLEKQGNPIPRLYAAGDTASGLEGQTYCGELCGSGLGFAMNSGRMREKAPLNPSWGNREN